jgi:hypothetical protein
MYYSKIVVILLSGHWSWWLRLLSPWWQTVLVDCVISNSHVLDVDIVLANSPSWHQTWLLRKLLV